VAAYLSTTVSSLDPAARQRPRRGACPTGGLPGRVGWIVRPMRVWQAVRTTVGSPPCRALDALIRPCWTLASRIRTEECFMRCVPATARSAVDPRCTRFDLQRCAATAAPCCSVGWSSHCRILASGRVRRWRVFARVGRTRLPQAQGATRFEQDAPW